MPPSRSRIERVCNKSLSRRPQKRVNPITTPIVDRHNDFREHIDQNTLRINSYSYESLHGSDGSIFQEYCSANSLLNPIPIAGQIAGGVHVHANDITLINPCHFLNEWPYYPSSHPSTVFRKSYLIYPRLFDSNSTIPLIHYGQSVVSQSFATFCNEDNVYRTVDHKFDKPIKSESFTSSNVHSSKHIQQFSQFNCLSDEEDIYMRPVKNLHAYADSTPRVGNVEQGNSNRFPGIVTQPLKTNLYSRCCASSPCVNSPSTLLSLSLTKLSSTPISTTVLTPLPTSNEMLLEQDSYNYSEATLEANDQWIEGDLGLLDCENQQNQLLEAWFESMERSNQYGITSLTTTNRLSPNQSNVIEDPNAFWDIYFCSLSPEIDSPLPDTGHSPSPPSSRCDNLPIGTVTDVRFDVISRASASAFTSQYNQVQAPCSTPKLDDNFSSTFFQNLPMYRNQGDTSASKHLATHDTNSTVYASVSIHHPRPKRPITLLRNVEFLCPSDDGSGIELLGRKKKKLKNEPDDSIEKLISMATVSSNELLQSNENLTQFEHYVPPADDLNALCPFHLHGEQLFTPENGRQENPDRCCGFLAGNANQFSSALFRSGTSLTEGLGPELRITQGIITGVFNRTTSDVGDTYNAQTAPTSK